MVAGFSDRIQVNFTGRARRVMVRAKEEARMLGHTWVGTEHLLLGLIGEEGGAAEVLKSLSISLEAARQQVEDIIGWGHEVPSGPAWFTPRAQRILHLAQQEALASRTAPAPSTSWSGSPMRPTVWPPRCWSRSART